MTEMPGLKIFSEYIRRHPIRFLIGGIALCCWFHVMRFWAAQAGIFANVGLPTSIYAPAFSWNMILGPIIEIIKGFEPEDFLKQSVFFIVILLVIASFFFPAQKTNGKSKAESKIGQFSRVAAFTLIPALLLPKSNINGYVDIMSMGSLSLILFSLWYRSRTLQTLTMLLGIGGAYFSAYKYFQEGKIFVSDCQLRVILKQSENPESVVGCWITSSEKYVVIKSNGEMLVLPREEITSFNFSKKGTWKL